MENTNQPQHASSYTNNNGFNNNIQIPQSMGMMEAVKSCFNKYAEFTGRARRSEYWYFYLFNIIVILPLYIIVLILIATENETLAIIPGVLVLLYALATIIPNLAAISRRLHDTNRSGWNYLFTLIPLVGSIIVLVFLVEDSKPGVNQWGPNPKGIGNNNANQNNGF